MATPETLQNFVGGAWTTSLASEFVDVHNPATGAVIAKTPLSTGEDLDAAVQAAKKAFPAWRDTPVVVRARAMFRFSIVYIAALFVGMVVVLSCLLLMLVFRSLAIPATVTSRRRLSPVPGAGVGGVGVGKMALASLLFGGWNELLGATTAPATMPSVRG